jgi:sigma-B regulation protein RsbU (phosphoserine phosphatase)
LNKDELALAAKVHYSFLPGHYANATVEMAVKMRPLNLLGGDYCSIYPIDEDCVLVCMCDAVGHNLASALFASRINTFVLSQALQKRCPCHMIEALNEHLCQRLASAGMFTSFFSVFIDTNKRELIFAGAGHPSALYFHSQNHHCEPLESVTTMLGITHPLPLSCTATCKPIQTGDKLILYTDGLIETRVDDGTLFGWKGLVEFTATHHCLDSHAFNDRLFERTNCERSVEIRDDILLLTITIL